MKRSVGMLRHACAGRQINRLQTPLSTPMTCISAVYRIHTSTTASFSFPSSNRFSEHTLNPATSSSSSSRNNHPIPPPTTSTPTPKKRTSSPASRQASANAQSRSAGKAYPPAIESKRATTGPTAAKESSVSFDASEKMKVQSTEADAAPSTTNPPSSQPSSSPKGGKEPPKTLLQKIKGLWESLKYLFRFYYQGVKQIWKDRTIVADLRKQVAERQAATGEGIRWIENAVVTRHEADLRKLPLFLAILLILEEILPLVVIYAPSLLPSTCVLPSQSTKMRSEEERKRGLAIQALAKNDRIRGVVEHLACQSEGKKSQETLDSSNVQALTKYGSNVIGEVAKLFALSSWGPATLISSRVEKHLNKLQANDEMLRHAYNSREKTSQWKEIGQSDWLSKACAQRGLRAFEADQQVMEQNLIAYLHLTSQELSLAHRSLLPLTLYDGTLKDLLRLQGEATQEASKGIKRRTREVVEEVTETEKKKEVEGK